MCSTAPQVRPRFARIDPTLTDEEDTEARCYLMKMSIQIVQHAPAHETCFLITSSDDKDCAYRLSAHYPHFRIVGIECLRYCIKRNIELPIRKSPVLNCKLKEYRIQLLQVSPNYIHQLSSFVESMEGIIVYDDSPTHIVVESLDSDECRSIMGELRNGERYVRIVKPQWLIDCWFSRIDKVPCESKYLHGLPIFGGFSFVLDGFPTEEEKELAKLAECFGGRICCNESSECTHIIRNSRARRNDEGARRNTLGAVVLTRKWLVQSCIQYKCVPCDSTRLQSAPANEPSTYADCIENKSMSNCASDFSLSMHGANEEVIAAGSTTSMFRKTIKSYLTFKKNQSTDGMHSINDVNSIQMHQKMQHCNPESAFKTEMKDTPSLQIGFKAKSEDGQGNEVVWESSIKSIITERHTQTKMDISKKSDTLDFALSHRSEFGSHQILQTDVGKSESLLSSTAPCTRKIFSDILNYMPTQATVSPVPDQERSSPVQLEVKPVITTSCHDGTGDLHNEDTQDNTNLRIAKSDDWPATCEKKGEKKRNTPSHFFVSSIFEKKVSHLLVTLFVMFL